MTMAWFDRIKASVDWDTVDQKQISKFLLQQEDIYIFERADTEEVVRLFPEWAEYIIRSNKLKQLAEQE